MFSLKLNGKSYNYFTEYNVNLIYNSVASTFSFTGFYDHKNPDHVKLFKPLKYQKVEIFRMINGKDELVLTGTILNTETKTGSTKELTTISGYSIPGVLGDCQIPYTEANYTLQFDNMSLKEITERIIKPFGISLVINDSVKDEADIKFEQVEAKTEQVIADFIAGLCVERNIILTHDKHGNLLFDRPRDSEKSVALYKENKPSVSIKVSVNGQAMHSSVTVLRQASSATNETDESTQKNDYVGSGEDSDTQIEKTSLIGKFRPLVQEQKTPDDSPDSKQKKTSKPAKTAKMIIAKEVSNIKLSIDTDRWVWTSDGKKLHLLTPNHIIDVISPENFINHAARFFVESVNLKGSREGENASITAVPAEAYTNESAQRFNINIFR